MAVATVSFAAVTYQASAAETPQGPPAGGGAAGIEAPAGLRSVGSFDVSTGTQTYTCAGGVFAGASVPEAQLVGEGGSIHHFKGPSWQSDSDGSLITAAKVGESPVAGAIPELLLKVNSSTGDGLLSEVTHIQRLRTSGGVAPARACTDGETTAVPYGATYVFLAPDSDAKNERNRDAARNEDERRRAADDRKREEARNQDERNRDAARNEDERRRAADDRKREEARNQDERNRDAARN